MHGIIFGELKKYVDTKMGGDAWNRLLSDAGLGTKMYMPIKEYPDEEAVAIISAAAKILKRDVSRIQKDFGEFIAPDLLKLYHRMVKPEWKTLDLIENTEDTIHRVVRLRNPGAKPPELKTQRKGPDHVVITYASSRKMCGVAIGIVKGIARHYNEKIRVTQSSCMHRGDAVCTISVKLVK